jgi:hypothetical protein
MAFCRQCGSPVEGAFCTKCGAKMDAPGSPGTPPPQPTPPPAAPPQAPSAPPLYAPPPSAAAPPQKKKGRWIFWTLGGCLGLIIIVFIILFAAGRYFIHKAGIDPALMEKDPAMAVAKMMATMNPDIEVLAIDEGQGIIRVRNKKTGETLAMNLKDAKNGKIVFMDEKGKSLEIKTQGEGANAGLEIKSDEGSLKMGANAAGQLPGWLPAYPGAEAAGAVTLNGENGNGGSCTFKSKDSVEAVSAYYENALKAAGFEVNKMPMQGQGGMIMLNASDNRTQREAHVTATHSADGTMITLMFKGK